MTDCYQCKEKPAVEGVLFPFCSPECKDIYNKDRPPVRIKTQRTIPEMQRIIMTQWRSNAPDREEFQTEEEIFT